MSYDIWHVWVSCGRFIRSSHGLIGGSMIERKGGRDYGWPAVPGVVLVDLWAPPGTAVPWQARVMDFPLSVRPVCCE